MQMEVTNNANKIKTGVKNMVPERADLAILFKQRFFSGNLLSSS